MLYRILLLTLLAGALLAPPVKAAKRASANCWRPIPSRRIGGTDNLPRVGRLGWPLGSSGRTPVRDSLVYGFAVADTNAAPLTYTYTAAENDQILADLEELRVRRTAAQTTQQEMDGLRAVVDQLTLANGRLSAQLITLKVQLNRVNEPAGMPASTPGRSGPGWLTRLGRTTLHVGIGVGIGVLGHWLR